VTWSSVCVCVVVNSCGGDKHSGSVKGLVADDMSDNSGEWEIPVSLSVPEHWSTGGGISIARSLGVCANLGCAGVDRTADKSGVILDWSWNKKKI
jgi:hypothetical protein